MRGISAAQPSLPRRAAGPEASWPLPSAAACAAGPASAETWSMAGPSAHARLSSTRCRSSALGVSRPKGLDSGLAAGLLPSNGGGTAAVLRRARRRRLCAPLTTCSMPRPRPGEQALADFPETSSSERGCWSSWRPVRAGSGRCATKQASTPFIVAQAHVPFRLRKQQKKADERTSSARRSKTCGCEARDAPVYFSAPKRPWDSSVRPAAAVAPAGRGTQSTHSTLSPLRVRIS
jgi:hypothetical protein